MSKHNYTNPAFCQNSEFYPATPSRHNDSSSYVEAIYNRSLNFNAMPSTNAGVSVREDQKCRIQRTMSSRSFSSQASAANRKKAAIQFHRELSQQQFQSNQHNYAEPQNCANEYNSSGRFALVPLEDLGKMATNNLYTIVPGTNFVSTKRLAKSQENLDHHYKVDMQRHQEAHSFHDDPSEEFTSLPPVLHHSNMPSSTQAPKIKHAFSSDFGSKSFLIYDRNSNQRYQMVPTAEDEEIVDENQEVIQMHNGRAHRYAVIPTEGDDGLDEMEEDETCLSASDLNQSHNMPRSHMQTSTPQKGSSVINLNSQPTAPYKNPVATRMLHELLSTPRKAPLPIRTSQSTPRKLDTQLEYKRRMQLYQSQQVINLASENFTSPLPVLPTRRGQRLHYEAVKPVVPATPSPLQHIPLHHNYNNNANANNQNDRTMAVITPRVAGDPKDHLHLEDCSSIQSKSFNNNSYPQKVANATVTLAVVSLMLVLGSVMNSGLCIYMIAHFGKAFYLQYSLVASFFAAGLGFLGFRTRRCRWLPNRSYTSGYVLVTMFALLKCCSLLVILVLDPFPGLPLHDVTTGVILGLSTFTILFIGLGVIGTVWCYRPPPDNRVNVV